MVDQGSEKSLRREIQVWMSYTKEITENLKNNKNSMVEIEMNQEQRSKMQRTGKLKRQENWRRKQK